MSNRGQNRPLPKETHGVTVWILDILETNLFDGRNPYERFVDDDGEPRFPYFEQETDDLRNALVGVLRCYLDPKVTCAALGSEERVTMIMGGSFKYSRWIPHSFALGPIVSAPPVMEEGISENLSEVLLVSGGSGCYKYPKVNYHALENVTGSKVHNPWNARNSHQDQNGPTSRTSTVVDQNNYIQPSASPIQSVISGVTEPLTAASVAPNEVTTCDKIRDGIHPVDPPSRPEGSTTSDTTDLSTAPSLAFHQNLENLEVSNPTKQDNSTSFVALPAESIISNDTKTSISSIDTSSQDPPTKIHSVIVGRNNIPDAQDVCQGSVMLGVQKSSSSASPRKVFQDLPSSLSGPSEIPSTIPSPKSKPSHIQSRKRRRRPEEKDTTVSSNETGSNNPITIPSSSIPGFGGKRSDVASAVSMTIEAIELFRCTPTEIRGFVEKLLVVEKHSTGLQALYTKILGSVDPRKPLTLRTNNASKRYMQMALRFVVLAKLIQRKKKSLGKSLRVPPKSRIPTSETGVRPSSLVIRNLLQKSRSGAESSPKDNDSAGVGDAIYEKVESIEVWASLLYQFGWAGALFFNWMIGLGTLGGYDPIQLCEWLKGQVQERLGKSALELFSVNEVPDLNVILRVVKRVELQKDK